MADATPKLLSGGNPQIPKGEGDGPVQAYIAAMPEWKRDLGAYLDDLIVRIDDYSIRSCNELRTILAKYSPADTVKVMWKRGTRVMTGDMQLAEVPK